MRDIKKAPLNILAAGTAFFGVLTLSSTLLAIVRLHRLVAVQTHLSVIAGVSLVYLAMLLKRGKHNAWLVSVVAYPLLLLHNSRHFIFSDDFSRHYLWLAFLDFILPALLLIGLLAWRTHFNVKSSAITFRVALQRTTIILAVTFLYGFIGFQFFDHRDFHQETTPATAAHYTIDQLGLTTNNRPITYTKRAVFFVDSLATISFMALAYAALAFFAPVRFRLRPQQHHLQAAHEIVSAYPSTSEDFFKLWPHDKQYYFNHRANAVIAYKVAKGVALIVGDPVGPKDELENLVLEFSEFCYVNDWRVAFIHTDVTNLQMYKRLGFESQKIGEEALVNIAEFRTSAAANKYFRNIKNRFVKQGYSFEVLPTPHSPEVISQLRDISDAWLEGPGREERTFMLGYFDQAYLNLCDLAVVLDPSGQISAFLNQVPTVKSGEANFDFLRSGRDSPSNINDFLMLSFMDYLSERGYEKVNMGLVPLAGIADQPKKGLVDNIFNFVYQYAGRFYSFQGLARFKSKYEPRWEDRYIVYDGGLAGLVRTLNALLSAMNLPKNKR